MSLIEKLKEKWVHEEVQVFEPVTNEKIEEFQNSKGVLLPDDLKKYFQSLNGTGGECTNELYEFYSLSRIQKVVNEFNNWEGIPDYKALFETSEIYNLFVFANFSFNLFAYAIKLSPEFSQKNEVYVLCGEQHKKIAASFSEFLEMYLNDSIELQLNEEA